jgi:hypothetical protein
MKARVHGNMLMVPPIPDLLRVKNVRDWARSLILREMYMKASGRKTILMAKEFTNGSTEIPMRENM